MGRKGGQWHFGFAQTKIHFGFGLTHVAVQGEPHFFHIRPPEQSEKLINAVHVCDIVNKKYYYAHGSIFLFLLVSRISYCKSGYCCWPFVFAIYLKTANILKCSD